MHKWMRQVYWHKNYVRKHLIKWSNMNKLVRLKVDAVNANSFVSLLLVVICRSTRGQIHAVHIVLMLLCVHGSPFLVQFLVLLHKFENVKPGIPTAGNIVCLSGRNFKYISYVHPFCFGIGILPYEFILSNIILVLFAIWQWWEQRNHLGAAESSQKMNYFSVMSEHLEPHALDICLFFVYFTEYFCKIQNATR